MFNNLDIPHTAAALAARFAQVYGIEVHRIVEGYVVMTDIPSDHHITYQLQYRKCGKAACSTCRNGQGHGPYWYAYWREGQRLRSGYIGKIHPSLRKSSPPPPPEKQEMAAEVMADECVPVLH